MFFQTHPPNPPPHPPPMATTSATLNHIIHIHHYNNCQSFITLISNFLIIILISVLQFWFIFLNWGCFNFPVIADA